MPIDDLPDTTTLKNYLIIHRPQDINTVYSSENLLSNPKNNELRALIINLKPDDTPLLFVYIIAQPIDIQTHGPNARILYLVEIKDILEHGSKHIQIASYINNIAKAKREVYAAGEIQIKKNITPTLEHYIIKYNFYSNATPITTQPTPTPPKSIVDSMKKFIFNYFNIIINAANANIEVSYASEEFTKQKLSVRKINKICKTLIKHRSKIPYYLAARSSDFTLSKLNDPNDPTNYNAHDLYIPYPNYSYIDPNDPIIEEFKHQEKLLCDTIFKYYTRPKIGLDSNLAESKYNISLNDIPFDDIYTQRSESNQPNQTQPNQTQPNQTQPNQTQPKTKPKYQSLFFNRLNRYFDPNDYIEINQEHSLIPTDPTDPTDPTNPTNNFNTNLYRNLLYAIINKHNYEYLRRHSADCLKYYPHFNLETISNIDPTLDNVYPSEEMLQRKGYTQISPILPYTSKKAYIGEADVPDIFTNKSATDSQKPITDPRKRITDPQIPTQDNVYYITNKTTNQDQPKIETKPKSIPLEKDESTLRVLSYNIHNWIRIIDHTIVGDTSKTFTDNKKRPYRDIEPFIKFFESTDADVIFLQELTPIHNYYNVNTNAYKPSFPKKNLLTYYEINNGQYNFKLIDQEMAKLGYTERFISNTLFERLPQEHGFFWLGNAIYSKYPLSNAVAHKLNYNRTCIFATIIHPITQVKYIVATTHLSYVNEAGIGYNPSYVQELSNISGLLADYMNTHECYNVILGGDFNHPNNYSYYSYYLILFERQRSFIFVYLNFGIYLYLIISIIDININIIQNSNFKFLKI
jgi:endonuclease/exonuclease/phosphatase family metal-dependent hydrolase